MSEPKGDYVYLGEGKGAEFVSYGEPHQVTLRDGTRAEVRPIHTVRLGDVKLYFCRADAEEGEPNG